MTYSHGSDEDRRKRVSFVIDLVTARCENVLVGLDQPVAIVVPGRGKVPDDVIFTHAFVLALSEDFGFSLVLPTEFETVSSAPNSSSSSNSVSR